MAKGHNIAFACTCGTVAGILRDVGPAMAQGMHSVCFCNSCRSALIYLDQPDPAPDPVALYQTTPDHLIIETGQDKLGAFKLGPKGPVRWYATCCGAPIGLTADGPGVPFVSFNVARLADPAPLGPPRGRVFVPGADGKQRHEGLPRFIVGMIRRTFGAWLTGAGRKNPFFDPATRKPVAPVHVLTKEERAKLPLR